MSPQVNELLLQMLETELGGVRVYKVALACVSNDELREEWEKYLKQTERHVEVMQSALPRSLGLTPSRKRLAVGSCAISARAWSRRWSSPSRAATRLVRSSSPANAWCRPRRRIT